jgi:hypothetical protein
MCDAENHSRRSFLRQAASGFGYLAFAGLATEAAAKDSPLAPRAPHFAPRAKRVIMLFMQGGPSHVDTFDYKPLLKRDDGKAKGAPGDGKKGGTLLGPRWAFRQHGRSGLWMSDLFPNLAAHADDLCILNGMHTDNPAHPQATLALHTGTAQFVRPSMGSWVLYGLGTTNENLPGFVSINPVTNVATHGAAFLPAAFQGTAVAGTREKAIANIAPGVPPALQKKQLDLVQAMNRDLEGRAPDCDEIEAVIDSYDLAFRMQSSVPEVMDVSREPKSVRDLYGTGAFGDQCLLARRLAETGVRFIEVTHRGWDQHRNLTAALTKNCETIDRPIAALLADLKQRGLLEDTLVVWGGEFGRTPTAQNEDGRAHNNRGYSMWMAGGGVRGGMTYGSTDDYGFSAVSGRMHVHDLHATILNQMGLDHEKLTYRYAGRDFRLTDVHGSVVREILA